ncbi:hypothetical protein GALMADRAFT_1320473 [Galerina marginata CBS 339.88]|uniref:Uncharacterized protein n=1 Tax=Galerina marginata (strain CBS 339.88) TaxID=685588 RepID=A0A067S632_GALM3|nr:hypothetical protein GALMADRAFT_1320473 [Galerina marginata CBS 339.88]
MIPVKLTVTVTGDPPIIFNVTLIAQSKEEAETLISKFQPLLLKEEEKADALHVVQFERHSIDSEVPGPFYPVYFGTISGQKISYTIYRQYDNVKSLFVSGKNRSWVKRDTVTAAIFFLYLNTEKASAKYVRPDKLLSPPAEATSSTAFCQPRHSQKECPVTTELTESIASLSISFRKGQSLADLQQGSSNRIVGRSADIETKSASSKIHQPESGLESASTGPRCRRCRTCGEKMLGHKKGHCSVMSPTGSVSANISAPLSLDMPSEILQWRNDILEIKKNQCPEAYVFAVPDNAVIPLRQFALDCGCFVFLRNNIVGGAGDLQEDRTINLVVANSVGAVEDICNEL